MTNPVSVEHIRRRDPAARLLEQPIPVAELPTPALVLDRPALGRNLSKMAGHLAQFGKGFRPHAKTHKCPLIAQLQLEAGAVGVCVAKVSEAVAMVNAGVHALLITSPITTSAKASIVGQLATQSDELNIVVDSAQGLQVLADALPDTAALGIIVDLDVAMGRTGTRDNDLVKRLVDLIGANPRMTFRGFQHYAGHVMHVAGFAERRDLSLSLWARIEERIADLAGQGISADIVTGGGTGTYNIDVEVAGVTDLQVGSYIFMDEEYRQIGGEGSERFTDFEVSLTMACTTISQPASKTITVDGGFKAFASDTVPPVCDELPGVKYRFAGDEHGVLIRPEGEQSLQLGQTVRVVTPHCDPTVNLHDYYWVLEDDGLIHSAWPITARGCSW